MNNTFRGLLADGEAQLIRLSTNNGLTGYKIVKFELMPAAPGTADAEHIAKIFTKKQLDLAGDPATVTGTLDFTNPTLVAAALTGNSTNITQNISQSIIFDNITFNQDIEVTHSDVSGSNSVNYLLELEQVKLSKDEATVATLKDMRAGPDTNFGS